MLCAARASAPWRDGDGDGRPRWFVRSRIGGRAGSGPLAAPLRVALRWGEAIDRVGTLASCTTTESTLRCTR